MKNNFIEKDDSWTLEMKSNEFFVLRRILSRVKETYSESADPDGTYPSYYDSFLCTLNEEEHNAFVNILEGLER